MSTTAQILAGSIVLIICSTVHIALMVSATRILLPYFKSPAGIHRWIKVSGTAFLTVLAGHTIQVWTWAFALILAGALSSINDAIYFSLVTYTTLGYGDVTLTDPFRVFGAMGAVTGMLNFGLSTAFLVSILTGLMRDAIKD